MILANNLTATLPRSSYAHGSVNLTTTTETTIVAGAAGLFNDIINIIISNQGAGNDIVTIRSGTAGTILATITSVANTTDVITLNNPIPATAVNQPITVQLSAASATGVRVSITVVRNS